MDENDDPRSAYPDAVEDKRLVLEPLTLPDGGWVQFRDPEEMTGKNVKELRRALDAPGSGSITNQLYETGMVLLIEAWQIPGKDNLRIPRYDKKATDQLSARQFRMIEKHMAPVLRAIARGEDDEDEDDEDRPGSPRRPVSD